MSQAKQNLAQAIAGESQAHIRYLAFAEKAAQDGYPGVAKLFRAAARSEMVHAQSHECALDTASEATKKLKSPETVKAAIIALQSQGAVKGTLENLQVAVEGETHEFKKMYPAMAQAAAADEETQARYSFEYAMSVEMIHAKLFKKALDDPEADSVAAYHICPVCGYTMANQPPKKCPLCGVDAKKFIQVD